MRDTPRMSFIGQFYSCMREVDRACNGYFSAAPRALPSATPATSQTPNRFELGPAAGMPARPAHVVERFLDIGCAPGGFAQFLLDHSTRWEGIGLTLEEGGHLMDERFMADARRSVASGGVAERFRLIYGDVTETPANMRFLPDGTRMPATSTAPPQFDLVIAGARSSKSEGSKGRHCWCLVSIPVDQLCCSAIGWLNYVLAQLRNVLARCREDPSRSSATRLLGQPEAWWQSRRRGEHHSAPHASRDALFSEGNLP
jgi:hypothetical protein|eukprot:COSAG02_NODE_1532_length_12086_cov_6.489447_12_plen_257_part_00